MILLAVFSAFQLAHHVQSPADSARVADGRLVIEPLRVSFEIPPTWLLPYTGYVPEGCGTHPLLCNRIHVSRESIAELRNAIGEWDREYSKVVDSVLPFDATVAQLGAEGWSWGSSSFADLQVRAYVSDLPLDSIAARARTTGVKTANKTFPTGAAQESDTLGWRTQKIQWDAWYYDYGATAHVEFFSRRIGSRTLTLVFMYVGFDKATSDRAIILQSFRIHSHDTTGRT